MRLINSILTILFIVLAATHIQVVDAWKWILLFGTMSILSVMAIFELYFIKILVALLTLILIWLIFLITNAHPALDFKSPVSKVGFCVLILFMFLFRSWYNSTHSKRNGK